MWSIAFWLLFRHNLLQGFYSIANHLWSKYEGNTNITVLRIKTQNSLLVWLNQITFFVLVLWFLRSFLAKFKQSISVQPLCHTLFICEVHDPLGPWSALCHSSLITTLVIWLKAILILALKLRKFVFVKY